MNTRLPELAWPFARLGEAIEAAARHQVPGARSVELPRPPRDLRPFDLEALGRWVQAAADCLGVEAEPVEAPYPEVRRLVSGAGPALFCLPVPGNVVFLVVLRRRGKYVSVLGPDSTPHRVEIATVCRALCRHLEEPIAAQVDQVLRDAGVRRRRQQRARTAIMGEQLSAARITGCWLFRLPPGASFAQQLRQGGMPRQLGILVGSHAAQHVLGIMAWWAIGWGALQGRLEAGWLIAWALLLASQIPLRMAMIWAQGRLAYGVGGLLKQRLLFGALRLDPQQTRRQGAGHLLGRVIESEVVETLAINGAFGGLIAIVEVVTALVVLSLGAAGGFLVLLFVGWLAMVVGACLWFYRHRRRWTVDRLNMTHELTERMIGHRTRITQETPSHWHDGEDQALGHYFSLSRKMDHLAVFLLGGVTRGWVIIGLLGLLPAFLWGGPSTGALAVAIGGILLGARAFGRITGSLAFLTDAFISWQQIAPMFHAARAPGGGGSPAHVLAQQALRGGSDHLRPADHQPIIEAHDLVFRYRDQGDPVLKDCALQVNPGDRLLLEGPSGGGKSTLASLLCGLRVPESGLILLRGLDRHTMGPQNWRRKVVAAPQFHENHILNGTFAFNLLMGRRWPPAAGDLEEAEATCRELGLGPLLERMPARLLQMLGETGWQLSHGEKSRLYIARALLQGAEVIVLDESFASLDPETLRLCLQCVLKRAQTLLVIAHP